MTKCWLVAGPDNVKWSIWDFGDEMTVHDGPGLLDRVVVRVPPELVRKLDAGGKWEHVVDAASAIHVARLLDSDYPTFRKLWRTN